MDRRGRPVPRTDRQKAPPPRAWDAGVSKQLRTWPGRRSAKAEPARASEIAQPPVRTPRLQAGEVRAGQIEDGEADDPNQVKQGQTPDGAGRRRRVAHGVIGKEPWVDG